MGLHPALTDPDEIAAAFKSVVDTFGSLDILANNAGTDSRTKLVDYTLEEFQKVMRLNVEATFVCSQAAARIMIEQGTGGAIINTSSMVSIYGQPAGCAYPTSKFAVNGLTKSLARELAPHKIRVNAVAPGVTHTDMVDALPREVIEPLIKTIPLGRMGEPKTSRTHLPSLHPTKQATFLATCFPWTAFPARNPKRNLSIATEAGAVRSCPASFIVR